MKRVINLRAVSIIAVILFFSWMGYIFSLKDGDKQRPPINAITQTVPISAIIQRLGTNTVAVRLADASEFNGFSVACDSGDNYRVRRAFGSDELESLFTIRVRGTNVFITTSNEVSLDQYWGPDDKYELRFWPAKEAK